MMVPAAACSFGSGLVMRLPAIAVCLLGMLFPLSVLASDLPTGELPIGEYRLTVEIAATPEARSRGLMFRRDMPENHGMLFVWDWDDIQSMWMRNTFLPLSVAFIDADFHVVNIEHMEPLTLQLHSSQLPIRYALEVHQGWFARHGVVPGTRLSGIEYALDTLVYP